MPSPARLLTIPNGKHQVGVVYHIIVPHEHTGTEVVVIDHCDLVRFFEYFFIASGFGGRPFQGLIRTGDSAFQLDVKVVMLPKLNDSFGKVHIDAESHTSNKMVIAIFKIISNSAIGTEESFANSSYYTDSGKYVNISNWVWKRRDGAERFSFDSDAERDWADILKDISSQSIRSIHTGKKKKNPLLGNVNLFGEVETDTLATEKDIFLWGKNYVPESTIKFEYYMGALHSSYPDFIMKDKFGRIHIFEVKSVNKAEGFDFDNNIYIAKVAELKKCYKQASKITGQLFYLPILREDVWQITAFKNGEERTLSLDQFRAFVNS